MGSLEIPQLGPQSREGSSKDLKRVVSATVDPGQLLLRLAGKPVNKKSELVEEKVQVKPQKNHKNSKTKGKDRKLSVKAQPQHSDMRDKFQVDPKCENNGSVDDTVPGHDISDWYGDENDLDETALSAFRELFNMLDQSNRGIITADNLFEELRRLDNDITFSEVEDVLKKVDKDGNGEIDFDEFLHHMTMMGGELFGDDGLVDEEKKKKFTRRQRLFYKAITRYSIKQTLADIEKTFQKQAPHVISHYTAGARLIGLTTRQLERQMKKMQKTAAQNDSPYAKPLQFVHMGAKKIVEGTHKKKLQEMLMEKSGTSQIKVEGHHEDSSQKDSAVDISQELKDTMKLFTEQRATQDANLIMRLREKIGTVMERQREQEKRLLSPIPILNKPMSASTFIRNKTKEENSRKKNSPRKAKCQPIQNCKGKLHPNLGWTTPRIHYIEVPLPSLKMKLKSERPTFNDLHRIRKKANEAIEKYYHNLRQTEIRNAWDHWDRLYADVILPKKLLENFRTVYSAYSPHREEEAFVVCPWKPGPFRYIRPVKKDVVRSLPNSPDFSFGRSSPRPFRNNKDGLTVRPASSMEH